VARTSTIASGPYETDAIASSENAASPPTTDSRSRASSADGRRRGGKAPIGGNAPAPGRIGTTARFSSA